MNIKHATRYRVTVNGAERYRDTRPTEDELANIEQFITNRGGHARVDECCTTADLSLVGTGRGISIVDRCIFEIEG
jgi:hypothetical protein